MNKKVKITLVSLVCIAFFIQNNKTYITKFAVTLTDGTVVSASIGV